MDEVVITLRAELRAMESAAEPDEPCTIYRVLPWVRNKHSEDYDPLIISIGPFHRSSDIVKPMEQLKLSFLNDLLNRKKQDPLLLDKYTEKVRELEVRTRNKYSPPPLETEIDSNSFVRMMVLDGCFLVEFLIKMYYESINQGKLKAAKWNLPLLRRDLLLLENQIPFFDPQSLFDLSDFSADLPDLDDACNDNVPITFLKLAVSHLTRDKFESVPRGLEPISVHHLLHLLHISLQPSSTQGERTTCSAVHMIKKVRSSALRSFCCLLSFILYCRLPSNARARTRAPRMFPSASELKESGIKFKKKDKWTSPLDVTFDFSEGVMEMPVLAIQEDTASQFRNLVAFEQCCPASGSHFTSYSSLLKNLISTPADVAVLKECGVVESKIANNKEMIGMFNQRHKGAYLNYEKHHFAKLFRDVNLYCEVDYHKWRAGLKRNYFGSPWTIISVFAAVFLLAVTVLQTFYTVYPYYRPSEH